MQYEITNIPNAVWKSSQLHTSDIATFATSTRFMSNAMDNSAWLKRHRGDGDK